MYRHARFQAWARAAAIAALLTVSIVAHAKINKSGASTAGFRAKGPAGLGIEGTTSELALADDGTTVTVSVPLGNLTTGIGLRDRHMKGYLEVDTYPSAELKVARSQLKFPASDSASESDAKGTMKIHGVTREVSFHYAAKLAGGAWAIRGSTRINMNDFGIKTPSYLGVSVKPDIDVFANFQAADDAPPQPSGGR
jgi:polyisoprenoid-binding protein YceI